MHALTKEERAFTEHIAALPEGKFTITQAYERWFPSEVKKILEEAARKKAAGAKTQPVQAVRNAAQRLFRTQRIQEYFNELRSMDADSARQVLLEKAVISNSESAAKQIIEQEDSLKFKDDVENFWVVTAEMGDALYKRVVSCPHCEGSITLELEVRELLGEIEGEPDRKLN